MNGALKAIKKLDRATYGSELALQFASKHGHLDVVKWLHDSKRMKNENGQKIGCDETAMSLAARNGHFQVVKYLFEKCKGRPRGIQKAIASAIQADHAKMVG